MLYLNLSNRNFKKENKDLNEENNKKEERIIKARQEISWLKTVLNMNRYGSPDTILSIASRKIDEIEEILEK